MGWFSGFGHALSKGVGEIDRAISGNNITSKLLDPMRGPSQKLTADIFGKNAIPTKLYGKITNHPLESAAAAAAAYYGGQYLYGGAGLDAAAGGLDAGAVGGAGLGSLDMGAEAGAYDAGLNALPDVGAAGLSDVAPGGAADLLLGGGGTDSAAYQAGDMIGQDFLSAPTTSSGFGGVGTDSGVSTLSDSGPSYWQQAKDAVGLNPATSGGGLTQQMLNVASKYGPLGLSLMRSAMSNSAGNKAASQIANTGGLQRQTATGLVQGYNNGTLNPADNAGIDQWAQNQINALRQFYANAGTGDSSQAKQAEAAIMAQATQMKAQARQNLLQTGLNELNGLDQNTIRAIQTNLAADQATSKAEADFTQEFFNLLGKNSGPSTTPGP